MPHVWGAPAHASPLVSLRGAQVFDDVWQQFARLASPSRGSGGGDIDYASPAEEFSSPEASNTTVLVAGATGRVGRILVRKLLLRGYKVSRPYVLHVCLCVRQHACMRL